MTAPIPVWGAGAIGGTLGAALARAGREVVLVDADAAPVAAIEAGGLRVEGPIRTGTVRAPAFGPAAVTGRLDLVLLRGLLCGEAHHAEAAARALRPHLATDGCVVSARNGLDERVVADVVGAGRTIGCFVDFGADHLGPGVVHHSGRGAAAVGEIDGAETPRIRAIHAPMRAFDEDAILTGGIWGHLRGELVCGALPFATAPTDDSIADVLDDARARPVPVRLGREVGAVAAAQGARTEGFDGFDPAACAPGAPGSALFGKMVAHSGRSAKPSSGVWRDLAIRRRETEGQAPLGPIVEAGRAGGVPTPLTRRPTALVREIEEGRRPLGRANLGALAEAAA